MYASESMARRFGPVKSKLGFRNVLGNDDAGLLLRSRWCRASSAIKMMQGFFCDQDDAGLLLRSR